MIAKKKLTPASICSQKAWGGLSKTVKKELRKNLKDTDRDGVPNGFDCRPKNRKRQEGFVPQDAAYLNSTTEIVPDKYLGDGVIGEVYTVKGNKHMVVKVPLGFVGARSRDSVSGRRRSIKSNSSDLQDEFDGYVNFNLENEPLFTPTKKVILPPNDLNMNGVIGLVRPRVRPMSEGEGNRTMTTKQLESLRRKLISISHKGFVLTDGLQVGIDRTGGPIMFDLGWIAKRTPSQAFQVNNRLWLNFIYRTYAMKTGKLLSLEERQQLHGTVNPNESY